MKIVDTLLVACIAVASATTAGAQTMKPGLWEMSSKMADGSGEMNSAMAEAQKHMDAMPAAQRKQMEAMMAKQGINMSMGKPGGGMSIKVCLTKEMIDRNEVAHQEGKCKQTSSQRSGNSLKFTVVCTEPPATSEGQVTFISPQAFTTKMTITSTGNGKPQTVQMESAGQYLSGDCGAIKPMVLPAK